MGDRCNEESGADSSTCLLVRRLVGRLETGLTARFGGKLVRGSGTVTLAKMVPGGGDGEALRTTALVLNAGEEAVSFLRKPQASRASFGGTNA